MTDKKQNEQQEELRDLDMPEKDAEDVKGGFELSIDGHSMLMETNGDQLFLRGKGKP